MAPANKKINHRIVPGKAEMWSDADDISWLVFLPGSEVSLGDIREIIDMAITTHQPGEFFHVLVDISEMETISPEARSYAAGGNLASIYDALAIVAASPATKLVANFFIRFHKPPRPTKIFTSREAAIKWLKGKR